MNTKGDLPISLLQKEGVFQILHTLLQYGFHVEICCHAIANVAASSDVKHHEAIKDMIPLIINYAKDKNKDIRRESLFVLFIFMYSAKDIILPSSDILQIIVSELSNTNDAYLVRDCCSNLAKTQRFAFVF